MLHIKMLMEDVFSAFTHTCFVHMFIVILYNNKKFENNFQKATNWLNARKMNHFNAQKIREQEFWVMELFTFDSEERGRDTGI